MSPTENQYRYKTAFSNGRWDILMEDDSGQTRLLYDKSSESAAMATIEFIRTCRTRIVTNPRMDDEKRWF